MIFSKINTFPSLGDECFYPFYLQAAGFNECEDIIDREEGYPHYLIVYTLNGEGELLIGGERYLLKENSSFIIRKNVPHKFHPVAGKWENHWLTFNGFAVEQMLDTMKIEDYGVFYNLPIEKLRLLLHEIYIYSTEKSEYGNFDISVMVYKFLVEYNKLINYPEILNCCECNHDSLLAAKRYIDQYYFKDLELKDIAEYAYVSKQHLCRLFQSYLHITPVQYLNGIRIKIAKRLLENTKMPIAEIAVEVGFNSPYYFSSIFKKYESITPTKYRIKFKRA